MRKNVWGMQAAPRTRPEGVGVGGCQTAPGTLYLGAGRGGVEGAEKLARWLHEEKKKCNGLWEKYLASKSGCL